MQSAGSRMAVLTTLFAAPILIAACSGGGQSSGIARGPSDRAIEARIAAPPDSVIQTAWETLRADGITPRSFQRTADDPANVATMESEWIYVPNVYPTDPPNWARLRTVPAAHPAWQYVQYTGDQLARRLEQ